MAPSRERSGLRDRLPRVGVGYRPGSSGASGAAAGLQVERGHLVHDPRRGAGGGANPVLGLGHEPSPSLSIRPIAATPREVADLTVPRLIRMTSATWSSGISR